MTSHARSRAHLATARKMAEERAKKAAEGISASPSISLSSGEPSMTTGALEPVVPGAATAGLIPLEQPRREGGEKGKRKGLETEEGSKVKKLKGSEAQGVFSKPRINPEVSFFRPQLTAERVMEEVPAILPETSVVTPEVITATSTWGTLASDLRAVAQEITANAEVEELSSIREEVTNQEVAADEAPEIIREREQVVDQAPLDLLVEKIVESSLNSQKEVVPEVQIEETGVQPSAEAEQGEERQVPTPVRVEVPSQEVEPEGAAGTQPSAGGEVRDEGLEEPETGRSPISFSGEQNSPGSSAESEDPLKKGKQTVAPFEYNEEGDVIGYLRRSPTRPSFALLDAMEEGTSSVALASDPVEKEVGEQLIDAEIMGATEGTQSEKMPDTAEPSLIIQIHSEEEEEDREELAGEVQMEGDARELEITLTSLETEVARDSTMEDLSLLGPTPSLEPHPALLTVVQNNKGKEKEQDQIRLAEGTTASDPLPNHTAEEVKKVKIVLGHLEKDVKDLQDELAGEKEELTNVSNTATWAKDEVFKLSGELETYEGDQRLLLSSLSGRIDSLEELRRVDQIARGQGNTLEANAYRMEGFQMCAMMMATQGYFPWALLDDPNFMRMITDKNALRIAMAQNEFLVGRPHGPPRDYPEGRYGSREPHPHSRYGPESRREYEPRKDGSGGSHHK